VISVRRAVLAMLLLASAASVAARSWESPAFAANERRPKRIAILAPRAEMVLARVNDAVPFVKETALIEDAVRAEAASVLRGLGYEPDVESLATARLSADPELKDLVTKLEIELGQLADVASQDPRDIRAGRFTVGETAAPVAARTGADGFLWLESQSIVPSKGQRALGTVMLALFGSGGVPTNQTSIVALLVDGHTGELARVSSAVVAGAVLKEPGPIGAKAVRSAFQDWPSSTTVRKLTRRQQRAHAASSEVASTPAAVAEDEEASARAAFEKAAAAAAAAPADDAERVEGRDDFAPAGPGLAADAASPVETAAPVATPPREAPVPEPPPPPVPAPAPAPSLAPPPPRSDDAKASWDLPESSRPAPSAKLAMQMLPGGPALVVRNSTREPLRVSVELGAFATIAPDAEQRFEASSGSRRVLVVREDGAEAARVSVLLGPASLASVEILPAR
jgi:hypothetical protein